MRRRKRPQIDEDYESVYRCRKGDVDAFGELVRKHQKSMLNVAYRIIGNYDEACEIVQDAFFSAYININRFKGKARFSTWLHAIVINLSRERLKRLKTQLRRELYSIDDSVHTNVDPLKVELTSNEPSALQRLEQRDIQELVQGCISTIHSDFREVLILRDIKGFLYNEISDMLKIPEGTVKSRLFRARELLRDCLKKMMGDL